MNFWGYLRDRATALCVSVAGMILTMVFLRIMDIGFDVIFLVAGFWILIAVALMATDYRRKKLAADRMKKTAENLKERYLLSEVIERPVKREYDPYYAILKIAGRSMMEKVTEIKNEGRDYREYIEQWVHEIKTPLAVTKLICENNRSDVTRKILAETDKTENYVEQALFYARSESVEQDFLVKELRLEPLVSSVVSQNKQLFIQNGMKVELSELDTCVYSDAKWLEFILKQLLLNCVQYKRFEGGTIRIFSLSAPQGMCRLTVEDNGVGILPSEISRVFDKGFTGSNGRRENKSTGIGLYLCAKLCAKLGLKISAESVPGEYTKIHIDFRP